MKWISVKDQLPEFYTFVLIYAKITKTSEPSKISIGRYNSLNWETLCNEEDNNACACGDLYWEIFPDEITHWMKLPEPPKD